MSNEFMCIACGAPVQPESDRDRMACPYCHTQLTIPAELRRKSAPVNEMPRTDTPPQLSPQETQQQVADFIRQVQPAATRAFGLYALTTRLRRFAPGCIVASLIACGVLCFLFAGLIAFIRK